MREYLEIEAKKDESRQREDDAGGDGLPGVACGLDDVVLEDGGAAECAKDADGKNRDGNGSGDGQTGAKADIDGDRAEDETEEAAEKDGAQRELGRFLIGGYERLKVGQRQPPATDKLTNSLKGECKAWPGVLCTVEVAGLSAIDGFEYRAVDRWGDLMINGAHVLLYTKDAEADRAFFRDVLGFRNVDAGHGWLIFALPPAELAMHPAEHNDRAELFLMCDDLKAEIAELVKKDVVFEEPHTERWGMVASIRLPGGGRLGLYQPSHSVAV